MSLPKLNVILGPTASGKTQLAIELAKQTSGEIISADSRQVYAGLNIGTAKPKDTWADDPHDVTTPDEVDGIPHYLLNIIEPNNPLTLAEWQRAAFMVIDDVITRGNTPYLVGGTMLYIDSIIYNYQLPAVPPDPALRARLEKRSTAELYEELLKKDPDATTFIEAHHKQRIIRALEVIDATSQPFSAQRRQRPPRYAVRIIGLFPGWPKLERRIQNRAEEMISEGLYEETQGLIARYGTGLPLFSTIQYAQAGQVLKGEWTKTEALEDMVRANLRYAKRQMSWWKGQKDISWLKQPDVDQALALL